MHDDLPPTDAAAEPTELPPEECLALLASRGYGRIGMNADPSPIILPVTYAVVDRRIVFRTDRGTALSTTAPGSDVTFEIDEVDPDTGQGWSVVVVGRAERISDRSLLERARAAPLASWVDPDHARYLAVSIDGVSGRRTHPGNQAPRPDDPSA